jgi:hypothetical protein
MKISDLQYILEKVKERYGDGIVSGECSNCGTTELEIFVVSSDYEKSVTIQVGNLPLIRED